jgi:hypothetical protein
MIGMNRQPGPRIIGGMFALPGMGSSGHSRPSFFTGKELLLVNGQSGVSVLVDRLSPANVWMPSYLCGSLLEAVQREGVRVRFYEVDYELRAPSLEWLNNVRRGDLVVFIDFFGFPCDVSSMDRARAQGAWVLEDACQALLSSRLGRCVDFTVFSPREFLGVPDGGILRVNCEIDFEGIELQSPPTDWWLRAVRASVLRREFDIYGGTQRWFELFQKSEAEAPLGRFAMSEFARTLLNHCFDYSEVARRRRCNYGILSE